MYAGKVEVVIVLVDEAVASLSPGHQVGSELEESNLGSVS